jgi:hypothetical protein
MPIELRSSGSGSPPIAVFSLPSRRIAAPFGVAPESATSNEPAAVV